MTDHGAIASLAIFKWAVQGNDVWASQCIERDGKIYMYVPISAQGSPKNVIAVAVADNPLGPYKDVWEGLAYGSNKLSSGNHPGIIDFKGKTYVSGFNYALNWEITEVHRERRCVCVAEMSYNPDGTIQKVPWRTKEGVAQVCRGAIKTGQHSAIKSGIIARNVIL